MGNYTSPAINYYRINANNTALAQSNSGGSANAPTEEIAAPVASPGAFSSYSTGSGVYTITGDSTNFNLFAVNQYLYYTDVATGDYKLVGQIATINVSGLTLTLTAGAVNEPDANSVLSAAYALITNNESIYMRIATIAGQANGTQDIPNFGVGYWRQAPNITGLNNTAQSSLVRVSNVGTPLSNSATTENIPFTFVTMNQFITATSIATGTTYFRSTADFPAYIWIRVTPQIGSSTSLSSQTLYRFTTQETMQALTIQAGTSAATLQNAGYSNVATGSSKQTAQS